MSRPTAHIAARSVLSAPRSVALAAGVAATSLAILVLVLASALGGPPAQTPTGSEEVTPGASPLSLSGAVSAALGAAQPAYSLRTGGDGAFDARNPAQHLGERFDAAGVSVRDAATTLRLHLAAIGRGARMVALASIAPLVRANTATYVRDGVSEWYANGPLGLEQGFTLARLPVGPHAAPLALAIALRTNAATAIDARGTALVLSQSGAPPLRLGGLLAEDARGRVLAAHMRLDAGRLLVSVDVRGAQAPIRIDPTLAEGEGLSGEREPLTGGPEEEDETKVLEHGGERHEVKVARGALGYSVALSSDGQTAIVGAPDDADYTGAAWVFTHTAGKWEQQGPKLTAPVPEQGEPCDTASEVDGCAFGRSVAISGDGNVAVVGSPRETEPCPGNAATMCPSAGAAWVFTRTGTTWTSQGALTASSEEGSEGRFGRSVAISQDGSTIVVGAPHDAAGRGSVWVFRRSGGSYALAGGRVTVPVIQGEGHLGAAVAVSADGSTLLAGAPGFHAYEGGAWLLEGPGLAQHELAGGEESGAAHIGAAVALSADGSTALLGGRHDAAGRGAAWVFARTGGAWAQQGPKLTGGAEQPEADGANFGYSVSLSASGDVALVGAPNDEGNIGGAWLFGRSGASWSQLGAKLRAPDESPRKGLFGASVALRADGLTAFVGAPNEAQGAGAGWPFVASALIPGVESVSPDEGPDTGGTVVTIAGQRLASAEAVYFGGREGQILGIGAEGSVIARTPPASNEHGEEVVCAEVRTAAGLSPAVCPAAATFHYVPRPAVAGLTPGVGPTGGGTSVTITGSGFTPRASVAFGSVAASAVTFISSTTITAVTPAEPQGEVDVTVAATGGASARNGTDRFAFVDPHSASTGSTAQVLSFGPSRPHGAGAAGACSAVLASTRINVPAGRKAQVKLRTALACRGRLTIAVATRVRVGRRSATRTRTIAAGVFTIAPGRVRIITLKLNARGRALLRAHHGRLTAALTITPSGASAARVRARRVHLMLTRVKPARRRA